MSRGTFIPRKQRYEEAHGWHLASDGQQKPKQRLCLLDRAAADAGLAFRRLRAVAAGRAARLSQGVCSLARALSPSPLVAEAVLRRHLLLLLWCW